MDEWLEGWTGKNKIHSVAVPELTTLVSVLPVFLLTVLSSIRRFFQFFYKLHILVQRLADKILATKIK
jgi:hypothetical protein